MKHLYESALLTFLLTIVAAYESIASEPPHGLLQRLQTGGYTIYLRHAATFHLEDTRRLTVAEQLECLGIVERDVTQIVFYGMSLIDQITGARHGTQSSQP